MPVCHRISINELVAEAISLGRRAEIALEDGNLLPQQASCLEAFKSQCYNFAGKMGYRVGDGNKKGLSDKPVVAPPSTEVPVGEPTVFPSLAMIAE